ncbi:MAG: Smr/MutS family protein [Nitrosomonas sp.]|nr:Smr/MutS family protein [Nitrosomonas sp.]
MKRRKKEPETTLAGNPDEKALFREAMQGVMPLAKPDTVIHHREQPQPIAHQIRHEEETAPQDSLSDYISLEIAAGDNWSFLRPGMTRQTLRRLRRGYWRIQAHLDLHGFTRNEARLELVTFLDACSSKGFRCVSVIHGKGLSSKNREPVLKTRIGNWLVQRHDVLAFCQARPEDGGSGAVLVLLKAATQQ